MTKPDASEQALDDLRIMNTPLRAEFSVDDDVYNLAAHNLKHSKDATEEDRRELAQMIQDVIDNFMFARFPV